MLFHCVLQFEVTAFFNLTYLQADFSQLMALKSRSTFCVQDVRIDCRQFSLTYNGSKATRSLGLTCNKCESLASRMFGVAGGVRGVGCEVDCCLTYLLACLLACLLAYLLTYLY